MYTLEQLSELLFGRSLRLKVARWVLTREDPVFFQSEAASGVGYSASAVTKELDRLVQLGMILRHDTSPGDRRQYYTRATSPFWRIVEAALEALQEQGDREQAGSSPAS